MQQKENELSQLKINAPVSPPAPEPDLQVEQENDNTPAASAPAAIPPMTPRNYPVTPPSNVPLPQH